METSEIHRIQKYLLRWYSKYHRQLPWRETNNPYHIWVSEVMLQQTQVKTVLPFYRNFLGRFPELKTLAEADMQEVLKVWEGLGYYARARNLHQAAKMVIQEYGGFIPDNMKEFRKIPGVGEYIASAVLSIAFGQAHAAVDGNVKRVLARLFQIKTLVNKTGAYRTFKDVAEKILDEREPGIFNQALMELGATVCKPKNPECAICPLESFCMVNRSGNVDGYPKRVKKKSVPEYTIVVGVVYKNKRVLITRRKPEGLLGGLWEFPGGKVLSDEEAEAACTREIQEEVNLVVEIDRHLTRVKHAYTHFKIVMDVFICKFVSGRVRLNGPADYRWVKLHELDQYPFPKANRKFIPLLTNTL
jgi:A/G-specific adenine glycosylase